MARITKREFINAQKIIKRYQDQLLEGSFQFIYYEDEHFNAEPQVKWIKAKNIDDACQKFIDYTNVNTDISIVDYEVGFKDQFFDISNRPEFHNYM